MSKEFDQLVKIMATLRAPGGCPWDREQTHASIRPYCIEEAFEVVEAIDEGDVNKLRDELGDLLLQVVFHAEMAEKSGMFAIADVIEGINSKLVRRHPHVFRKEIGDEVKNASEVLERWAEIKKKEGREHLLDGIPKALPALLRATRMGEKASGVGFDWKTANEVWAKVEEELEEVQKSFGNREKLEEELGDLMFALTQFCRHSNIDAETSLRQATVKFENRFRWMETEVKKLGKELKNLSADELDQLWNRAKIA